MLIHRVLSALVGIPLFIGALYSGGTVWAILLGFLAVLGARESQNLLGKQIDQARSLFDGWISPALAALLVFSAYLSAYALDGDGSYRWNGLFLLGPVLMVVVAYHALWSTRGIQGVGESLAAAFYPGLFFALLLLLREASLAVAAFAIVATWASDTAAYAVGSLWGRRRLWPAISPNKSVEGAVGGCVAGTITGMVFAWYGEGMLAVWAAMGFAVSVAGQLGDLAESGLKRRAAVKDSGALLPGHGGVLDRFDSLFFAGTLVYYLHPLLR